MGKSIQVPSNAQDILATLRRWNLIQDNSGPFRTYYNAQNPDERFHSVTHILSKTQDQRGLERWRARIGYEAADMERDVAATRGTEAHSSAEFLLKTAASLARRAGNKRGIKFDSQGLARIPSPVTRWALEKVRPRVKPSGWASQGYSDSLLDWIMENVTAIHASEFMICHPAGFAGQADALLELKGHGLCVVDFKTSQRRKVPLGNSHSYRHQIGAYSAGLRHLTGLDVAGAAIVLARQSGKADVEMMDYDEVKEAEQIYLDRCHSYFESLEIPEMAIHSA